MQDVLNIVRHLSFCSSVTDFLFTNQKERKEIKCCCRSEWKNNSVVTVIQQKYLVSHLFLDYTPWFCTGLWLKAVTLQVLPSRTEVVLLPLYGSEKTFTLSRCSSKASGLQISFWIRADWGLNCPGTERLRQQPPEHCTVPWRDAELSRNIMRKGP